MLRETPFGTLYDNDPDNPYTRERPPFLVAGLIPSGLGLVFGKQAAGKSTVAGSLAVAIAGAQAGWQGQEVTANGSVLVVAGDDPNEWYERLDAAKGLRKGTITTYAPNLPMLAGAWEYAGHIAADMNAALVIVDNLSVFAPRGLNDDVSINLLYDALTQAFLRKGIPACVLAHASEKQPSQGQYGAPTPMGSSAISFRPRWRVNVYQSGGKLHLWAGGNSGASGRMALSLPDGSLDFELVTAWSETGTGKPESTEDDLLIRLRNGGPWSTMQAAADDLKVHRSTVSRTLRDAGLTLDQLSEKVA